MGRTEFRPKDYMRTFVDDDEFVQPKRNQTTPRSECRFTFKNTLTQPRLLEMAVKPAIRRVKPNCLKSQVLGKFMVEVADNAVFRELRLTSTRIILTDAFAFGCVSQRETLRVSMGFSVAGAFELAVELGGGIVWVALIVVFGRFSLTLFESVDEIGLGDGLETEKRNAERAGGGVKAEVLLRNG